MHLQKARLSNGTTLWLVLDEQYLPIQPIKEFLSYLNNITENSVNSLRAYANHLRLYWEYLASIQQDWTTITYSELANFIQWLRYSSNTIVPIQSQLARRKPSTINTILAAVSSFYNFHQKLENVSITLTTESNFSSCTYRSLLHHVKKNKYLKNQLKVKEPRKELNILTQEQIEEIKGHCNSLRDKFLISLLCETGLRIGQALGLHHEDIESWNNEIVIRHRNDLKNGARSKSRDEQIVHVSDDLMKLYADYVITECHNIKSDFVFVVLQNRDRGNPYSFSATQSLFRRLSKKIGIHITPHYFRHWHASDLIKSGWDCSYVQKRLGHSSVQTIIELYTHLDNDDLKKAFKKYQQQKEKGTPHEQ